MSDEDKRPNEREVGLRVHGDKGYCPKCGRVYRGLTAMATVKQMAEERICND